MSDKKLESITSEYIGYDGLGLAELVAKGEVTPTELLETAIAQAEAINPRINCLTAELYDHAHHQIKDGLPDGAFNGVPFVLKDLSTNLKGTVTSAASRFFANNMATEDSTLASRYKNAGLVIFAKTTTPELGLTGTTESALFGLTRNPWNLAKTTGGSSGGSGAAVAAGIVPMANASDGAGSIRTPSSCCGVFGLKPTRARVPLGPSRNEGWNGLSTVHAITRSVRDNAALLDISHGPGVGDPYRAPVSQRPFLQEVGAYPGQLRIALIKVPTSGGAVHPECVKAADNAATLCADLGHNVEEASFPINHQKVNDGLVATLAVSVAKSIQDRAAVLGRDVTQADVEPVTWQFYTMGLDVRGVEYARARAAFDEAGRVMTMFHQSYDVILTPTLAKPPIDLGLMSLSPENYDAFLEEVSTFGPFTALYNYTGQPAMSVPLHWTPDGLPVGTMFAAPYGREDTLFRLAAQLEEARPWFDKRPRT